MHNMFGNLLGFKYHFAHYNAVSNDFNDNDQNRILHVGK